MTIVTALAAINTVVGAVTGINQSMGYPAETSSVYPVAVCYVRDGTLQSGSLDGQKHLVNIAIDVMTARKILEIDMTTVTKFIDSVPAALLAQVTGTGGQFSGTIITFDTINYELLDTSYAGVQMIGYRFIMGNVKIF